VTTLVTVFAHPDDETFSVGGSVAAAVDAGVHVSAICATRGEAGEIADEALATRETLGQVREGELRAACAALGVHDVKVLHYRDSGMEGTAENADPRAFVNAPDPEVVDRLSGLFAELRPDVVVTFHPGGVYGHPDHKKVSRCATMAFDRVPGTRLFHAAPSRSAFRAMLDDARAEGITGFPFEDDSFGVPDEEITTTVDVRSCLERKKRALRAHRSQLDPWLLALPEHLLDRMLATETFALVRGELTAGARTSVVAGLSD
jgi:LmbE family N-acetylglucosaminyl deacetylase